MGNVLIKALYYITHIDNIPSILNLGVLSHNRVEEAKLEFTRIYDVGIVDYRRDIEAPDGTSLWGFANLYFQPRNPMLFRVLREKPVEDIVIVAVRPDILNRSDIFISTGNAASTLSDILPPIDGLKRIPEIRDAISKIWWSEEDGSKRKIMAECLVPDAVPPDAIQAIYVANHEVADKVKELIQRPELPIIPEPQMFFEPASQIRLTPYLSLVEGDMFFSRMQTLTVSVNCVGVMGAGLASRAKYQFPDVYVFYQDLCREGALRMGKPYLYKRESSLDYQLADEPSPIWNTNSDTWFLLFPTKRHWRERADIHGIEQGMRWIRENYREEGMESLAVPALGCGLGWLQWRDVGPLLCRYLSSLDIPTWVYLPAEKEIPEELLSRDFLLEQS